MNQDIIKKTPGKEVWLRRSSGDNYYGDTSFEGHFIRYKKNLIFFNPEFVELNDKSFKTIIIGNNSATVSANLNHIIQVIEESRYIPQLEPDWNSNGAQKIDTSIWNMSSLLLINYSKFILENFSTVIQAPEINPCPNGSIDIVWRTQKARLLVNIKSSPNPVFASYYGDLYNNEQPIKNVMLNEKIIEHLAYWMKNLS